MEAWARLALAGIGVAGVAGLVYWLVGPGRTAQIEARRVRGMFPRGQLETLILPVPDMERYVVVHSIAEERPGTTYGRVAIVSAENSRLAVLADSDALSCVLLSPLPPASVVGSPGDRAVVFARELAGVGKSVAWGLGILRLRDLRHTSVRLPGLPVGISEARAGELEVAIRDGGPVSVALAPLFSAEGSANAVESPGNL